MQYNPVSIVFASISIEWSQYTASETTTTMDYATIISYKVARWGKIVDIDLRVYFSIAVSSPPLK